ncbi:MAG: molecular chaperone DnaJ [Acidobacteriota bacterium]
MAERDYYRILGVGRSCSQSDLKKAYRRLARKYHPDINPGDKASEEQFKQVQEAYDVLGDPEKRKAYDQFGDLRGGSRDSRSSPGFGGFRGFDSGDFAPGGSSSFGDIFADLFGTRRRSRSAPQPQSGQDLEYHISIPFQDAMKGQTTRINFTRRETCGKCRGKGSVSGKTSGTCRACGGRGQVQQRHGTMRFTTTCRQCGGSGRARSRDCRRCGGSGTVARVEALSVKIPAGVNTGSRIRVPHKGSAGDFGGPPGDLYLVVTVQPHPLFRRKGKDVLCTIPVTLTEATLGARIEVPTVDGKAWLKIPPGTQSGQRFRLRGRGAPPLRKGPRGDQIVEVHLVLPAVGDERSKEILREFAQLNPQNPRDGLGLR